MNETQTTAKFKIVLDHVAQGHELDATEAGHAFAMLASGTLPSAQVGAFLLGLRVRGETVGEMVAAARTMRSLMLPVRAPAGAVDILGTGGDGSGSFNVSTCAAFIVAGTGTPVAKQGNRAFTSKCGAADVLSHLGVDLDLDGTDIEACIEHTGIGFLFAPRHHPALAHVMQVRRDLGTRTIFNLLGPVINAANVRLHMIGVYDARWCTPVAEALGVLGSERAFVVCADDGMDEVSTAGRTHIAYLRDGAVQHLEVEPEDFGVPRVPAEALRGGTPAENAVALRNVLDATPSPFADIAIVNAACALFVASRVDDLRQGVEMARASIRSGAARRCLDAMVAFGEARNPRSPR